MNRTLRAFQVFAVIFFASTGITAGTIGGLALGRTLLALQNAEARPGKVKSYRPANWSVGGELIYTYRENGTEREGLESTPYTPTVFFENFKTGDPLTTYFPTGPAGERYIRGSNGRIMGYFLIFLIGIILSLIAAQCTNQKKFLAMLRN